MRTWFVVSVVAGFVVINLLFMFDYDVLEYIFPPHLRSLIILLLGTWLWICNYYGLAILGFDLANLISVPSEDRLNEELNLDSPLTDDGGDSTDSPPTPPGLKYLRLRHRRGMVRLAKVMTVLVFLMLILFYLFLGQSFVSRDGKLNSRVEGNPMLPQPDSDEMEWSLSSVQLFLSACFLFPMLVMSLPFDIFELKERVQFWKAVGRIMFGSLKETTSFADVLFADMLTSYSRALGDICIAFCSVLFEPSEQIFISPVCSSSAMVHITVSLPFLWRFRQCLVDYFASGRTQKSALWNALKYFSMVFVLIFSYMTQTRHSRFFFNIWVLFAVLNSLYSLFWDLRMDWGLLRLRSRNFLLRDHLYFNISHIERLVGWNVPASSPAPFQEGSPRLYYVIMLVNFLARFAWAWRLILLQYGIIRNHPLHSFLLQVIEVFRRSLWIFLRVEKQYWRD